MKNLDIIDISFPLFFLIIKKTIYKATSGELIQINGINEKHICDLILWFERTHILIVEEKSVDFLKSIIIKKS